MVTITSNQGTGVGSFKPRRGHTYVTRPLTGGGNCTKIRLQLNREQRAFQRCRGYKTGRSEKRLILIWEGKDDDRRVHYSAGEASKLYARLFSAGPRRACGIISAPGKTRRLTGVSGGEGTRMAETNRDQRPVAFCCRCLR